MYFMMVYIFICFNWLFYTIYHFSLSVDNIIKSFPYSVKFRLYAENVYMAS